MSSKRVSAKPFPSYRNPPVIEVVCGLRFQPLEPFKIPHIGLFWTKVLSDFPNCEHAPPLSFGPETFDPSSGLPIPRIWLINEKDNRLIQIQKDAFLYNWRKRSEDEPYPRYKSIIRPFKKYLNDFSKFLKEHKISPIVPIDCELTYINHITVEHGWKPGSQVGKFLPDVWWRARRGRFLPRPATIVWRARVPLPEDNGQLIIKLEQGTRKIDNVPILKLELSARGLGADKTLKSVWNWFEVAHEWIVRGFADLTSFEVQERVWKRYDKSTG